MKHFWTLLLTFMIALLIAGCAQLGSFPATGPGTGHVLVDQNDDGHMDGIGVDADQDGQVDLDEDGHPIIVEGTSTAFNPSEDEMAGDTFGLLAMIGIPGAVLASGIFAKFRPIRRIRDMQYLATRMVGSIQTVRNSGLVDKEALDSALRASQEGDSGRLERLIREAKLAMKPEKK